MSDFVRARTESQFQERRDMILSACHKIYLERGFQGVTFNTVSEMTSFTRPALYNYYRNRELMLLDLLKSESTKWLDDLKVAVKSLGTPTREELCRFMADQICDCELVFRLISDLKYIEKCCTAEEVRGMRAIFVDISAFVDRYIRNLYPDAKEETMQAFHDCCSFITLGAFSFSPLREGTDMHLRDMVYRAFMSCTSDFE